jgi:hypothetical protein
MLLQDAGQCVKEHDLIVTEYQRGHRHHPPESSWRRRRLSNWPLMLAPARTILMIHSFKTVFTGNHSRCSQ